MSPIKTCETSSDARASDPSALTSAGNEGLFRAALLAGASLIALAAFGAPDVARACVPTPQTISTPTGGPVLSNGGAITVTSSGSIAGSPDGVDAPTCSVSTLMNSGSISGAGGAAGAPGGVGVSNAKGVTIGSLANNASGTIIGGNGGATSSAPGGAGVSNAGAIMTLTNSGQISGGNGGFGPGLIGGPGGAGVSNAGAITTLTNSGRISGGAGASFTGAGGAGVFEHGDDRITD
jgi:hypothetical protein